MMVKVFDMFEDGVSSGRVPLPAMTYRLMHFGKVADRIAAPSNYREPDEGVPRITARPSPEEMSYTLCDDHRHYVLVERCSDLLLHADLVDSKACDNTCKHPTFYEGVDTELHISSAARAVFRKERRRQMPLIIRRNMSAFLRSLVTGNAY